MTTILCACGCGEPLNIAKYPSQQSRYINHHQHRGRHNGNYKGGKQRFVCPVCGKAFEDWPSQKPVTCGKDECYRKWHSAMTAARGQNKVRVACQHCGKDVLKYPSLASRRRNYCSNKCRTTGEGRVYSGENAKNWKGGGDTYVRKAVRRRDNFSCVVCGFADVTDVHHIIERANGGTNDLSNLLTLCPNHHRMAHKGMIDLEPYRRV